MTVFDTIWQLAGFVESVAVTMWDLITGLYGIMVTVYGIISDFMALFPGPIQGLIISAALIASFYYIYNWIKGISIAGFKI